jgi:hypothetical protein
VFRVLEGHNRQEQNAFVAVSVQSGKALIWQVTKMLKKGDSWQ